jgi:hypothetical protein
MEYSADADFLVNPSSIHRLYIMQSISKSSTLTQLVFFPFKSNALLLDSIGVQVMNIHLLCKILNELHII